jgi:hypothetical protein
MIGESLSPLANFKLIANAAKLTAELLRTLISGEPLGNLLRVAVICASNEKQYESTDAMNIPVLVAILTADFVSTMV